MIDPTSLPLAIHYLCVGLIIVLTSLGVGFGGGCASSGALSALNVQPEAKSEIGRAMLIGLALIETAAILGLIITIMLLLSTTKKITGLPPALAEIGITLSIGLTGFFAGYGSSLPVEKACLSIARQPFFGQKIINIMLITQTIIQTAAIFGFLIAFLIWLQLSALSHVIQGFSLLTAGIAMGVGSIGPIIGLSRFAQTACSSISTNRKVYGKLISFVFISSAIIETPIIFSFLVALILTLNAVNTPYTFLNGIKVFSAALCIALGTLSPGIQLSNPATAACSQIARKPELYSTLTQLSIFGQGLIDSSAIYALLVSLIIIFIT